MTHLLREIRLFPIVLIATVSLLVLKVSGLVFEGGYTLAERVQGRDRAALQVTTRESVPESPRIVMGGDRTKTAQAAPKSWAQEMFNYNGASDRGGADRDVTGSVGANEQKTSEPPLKTSTKPPDAPKLEVAGASIPMEQGKVNSPGERAVLERLQDRRHELDTRNRELEMRETLLKAAEKRLDAKVHELKDIESRVQTVQETREKVDVQRLKGIVSMYENMKPKEAARIFDRLDIKILVEVSTAMNPRTMSAILAQMSPEAAERLTVELAGRAGSQPAAAADELPKIDGRPNGG